MKLANKPKAAGFTLVELLVVIVIIASLAALSFTVGPKMMRKAKATEAMQNIRQIASLMTTYATDHNMRLPAAKGPVLQPDGTTEDLQWNEACVATLYPDTPPEQFKTKAWWEKNKVFLRNPLFKAWTPLKTGFAMNQMISENVSKLAADADGGEAASDPLSVSVPLTAIPDASQTPLVIPFDNYIYRLDVGNDIKRFKTAPLKDLTIEDRITVVFVDGHIESMLPSAYLERKLSEQPLVP